jgi:phage-related protein
MRDIGERWSETLDRSLERGSRDVGQHAARSISEAIDHEGVHVSNITFETDANGNITRTWVRTIARDMERAVRDEAGGGGGGGGAGGVFRPVSTAIRDAIGSGFDVSGKSPLIALLIPVLGEIALLIGSAIQAAGALSALLFTIPNLIFAIGVEAGTLLLAFQGVGTAIQGAFAATNADELKKALEGLTPAAQNFVKQLLPMKDLFNQLRDIAQEGFFAQLDNVLTRVFNAGSPFFNALKNNIGPLAESLGGVAHNLIGFLNDPAFIRFINWIIPQVTTWLDKFGPSMLTFLNGLSNIGFAILPLFVWLGDVVNNTLSDFGEWLTRLSTDQGFLDWIEEVKGDLAGAWEVFKQLGILIFDFVDQLNTAGGDKLITDLVEQLKLLDEFLTSDAGQKAMEGLLHTIELLAIGFLGLAFALGFLFTAIEVSAEFIKNDIIPAVGVFFTWLGQGILDFVHAAGSAIANFFTVTIPNLLQGIRDWVNSWTGNFFNELGAAFWGLVGNVGGAFTWVVDHIREVADNVRQWFNDRVQDAKDFIENIRRSLGDAALQFLNVLYQAGRNAISGLIEGIKSMFGSLGNVVGQAAGIVRGFWPFSPAKEGPLSGSGDPMIAGQKLIQRIATGIEMEAPALSNATSNAASNVLMGAGAVQMNFYGAPPSTAQAAAIGNAAGGSLADTLAQRNTRLAVRSIGAAA